MRTYRSASIGPEDQEDQVKRELAGSPLLRTAKSVAAGATRQGRAGFHGWSSPRNCTLIPRTPRSTLGSYPDLPTAAPDHSLLRLPWSALYASSHVSIRRPHLPVSSLLKAQGSGCLACPRLFCCLSLQPIVSCHPAPYSLFSLHTHSAFPPINTRPTLYYCRSALRLKPCLRLSSSLPLAAASFNLYTLLSRQRGWCRCSSPGDRGTWNKPSRGQPLSHHPYDCDCDGLDREEHIHSH